MDDLCVATPSFIDQDIPCRQCRYDLRGLMPEGRCPECGSEIIPSIYAWRVAGLCLKDADPAWLRTKYQALWLIVGSQLLIACAMLAPRSVWFDENQGRKTLLWISCIAWTCAHWGIWKIMASEYKHPWRRLIPLVSVLVPAWGCLDLAVTRRFGWSIGDWPEWVVVWSLTATLLCMVVCFDRLRAMARLAKNRWLNIGATMQMVMMPASHGLLYLYHYPIYSWRPSLEALCCMPFPSLGLPYLIHIWFLEFTSWRSLVSGWLGLWILCLTLLQILSIATCLSSLYIVWRARRMQKIAAADALATLVTNRISVDRTPLPKDN